MAAAGRGRRTDVDSQVPRNSANRIVLGRALQLDHLAECMVQNYAVQHHDHHDGQEAHDRSEENQLGRGEQDEPAPTSLFRVPTPTEGGQKSNYDTYGDREG